MNLTPRYIFTRGLWWLVVRAGLVLIAAILPLAGAEKTEVLLATGARHLAAGEFDRALAVFSDAARLHPDDGEVLFFNAAALNRLSRFAESEASLRKALTLSPAHPDAQFELGWSLAGQAKWSEAITALESFERAHPGRGQASEFLGRCHLALGDHLAAERCFAEALSRDPSLAETVNAARGLIGEEWMAPMSFAHEGGWQLGGGLAVAAGRSTNILGVSHEFERLPGFPELDAAFILAAAELSLGRAVGDPTEIEFKAGLEWISYDGASAANMLDVTAGIDLRHRLADAWLARLQAGSDHAEIGGEPFRTVWLARPSLVWQQSERSATEIGGSAGLADYQVPLPAPLDRDARSYGIDATQHFWFADGRARVFASGFARWDESDGREFDGRFFGVKAGIAANLPWRTEVEASYAVAFDRYDELSLLTADGQTRRKGDTQMVAVQFSKAVADGVSAFVRYSYLVSSSTVSFYEYDQHLWMAGVRWVF